MSASPIARQAWSQGQTIPTRKIVISDPIEMPEVYSATPGGTVYSTTPGGTRIIYERAFMKTLKSSPLSKTPPSNVPICLLRGTPRQPYSRKCVPAPKPIDKTPKKMGLKIEDQQEQFQLEL